MTTRFFVLMPLAWLSCLPPAAAQAVYTPYTFTTLAGNAGYGSADGTGSAARFKRPQGLAADNAGNIYVADTYNDTIRIMTPAGVVTTLAGQAGSVGTNDGTGGDARFGNLYGSVPVGPAGVAADGAGNVYVADTYSHTIRRVTSMGVVTTLAGLPGVPGSSNGMGGAARFNYPQGVAVDSNTNVYVADTGNNTIRQITAAGAVTTLAGLAGSTGSADNTGAAARFNGPSGLVMNAAGNIYVADTYSHTVRKMTLTGTNWAVSTPAGLAGTPGTNDGAGNTARFNYPQGLTTDTNGNVYVADTINYLLRKMTPQGVVTTLVGLAYYSGSADGTNGAARFYGPSGVAVYTNGSLFVSDRDNNTIRQVTPLGSNWVVTTPAGMAGGSGAVDATGSAARFNQPSGVAVDANSNLYVADSNNHTIRAVTPAGAVTTLAGMAGAPGTNDGTGSAARFNQPFGVAVDSAGNLYVGDFNNQTIRKMTPVGTNWMVGTLAGLAGVSGTNDGMGNIARFFNPAGVAVDAAGNVYVADYSNHTIRQVTPAGMVSTLAGLAGSFGAANGTGNIARFYYPYGVAVDAASNVYVADSGYYLVRKVTPAGAVTTPAGLAGNPGSADGLGSAARFYYPDGVAVDGAGSVYVADYANNTLRRLTPAGTNWMVNTLAGLAGNNNNGSADGTGSAARFNAPYGVAVDGAGRVYVADTDNNEIRAGFPAISAPVIITGSVAFAGGQCGFNLTGAAGQTVVVEASIDLAANWLPIWTNTFGAGLLPFSDSQGGMFSQRFYRARSP